MSVSMPTGPDVIVQAAAATNTISKEIDRACGALNTIVGRMLNGNGVYANPALCRRAIVRARDALNDALTAMDATTWPDDAIKLPAEPLP